MYRLFTISTLALVLFLSTELTVLAVDRSDREEYDLYWRNREGRDFNPYDYPNNTNENGRTYYRQLADNENNLQSPSSINAQ